MSTAARKARKRAGEKIQRAPKVGTPLAHRLMRNQNAWRERAKITQMLRAIDIENQEES